MTYREFADSYVWIEAAKKARKRSWKLNATAIKTTDFYKHEKTQQNKFKSP